MPFHPRAGYFQDVISPLLALGLSVISVRSPAPGCVAERDVRAALQARLEVAPGDEDGEDGYFLEYRVDPLQNVQAFRLHFELVADDRESVVVRDLDLSESDCGGVPALLAAIVERHFRALGWTDGEPLPRRRETPSGDRTELGARPKTAPRAPSAIEKRPDAAKPDATKPDATKPDATKPDASPDAAQRGKGAERLPWFSGHIGVMVDSYPATHVRGSGGARLWIAHRLAAEIGAQLPASKTVGLGSGEATLESWSLRGFASYVAAIGPVRLHGGPVVGLSFEKGSTRGIPETGTKDRLVVDVGLGAQVDISIVEPLRLGVFAYGAQAVGGKRFIVDHADDLEAPPWDASGLRGGIGLRAEIVFAH